MSPKTGDHVSHRGGQKLMNLKIGDLIKAPNGRPFVVVGVDADFVMLKATDVPEGDPNPLVSFPQGLVEGWTHDTNNSSA